MFPTLIRTLPGGRIERSWLPISHSGLGLSGSPLLFVERQV